MANGKTFEPKGKYSSPSMQSTITLNSEQAIRLFRRCFETASHSLFVIDVVSRALAAGTNDKEYSKVDATVSTMLTDMESLIANEASRIEALLKAHGFENWKPDYSQPTPFSFKIASPVILRFAQILLEFDKMIARIDTAWLAQLIDTKKCQELHKEKLHWAMRQVRKLQALSTAAIKRGRKVKLDPSLLDELEQKSAANAEQMERDDDGQGDEKLEHSEAGAGADVVPSERQVATA
ncbi:TPA: hypothetical protein ACKRQV_000198 [Pseudomonas aeruginosa]|nr:DUF1845 family protein [Pseudomonas aeruginosa]EIU2862479.1 DUF1845 family protein [Pseudomonas aeruginosa]